MLAIALALLNPQLAADTQLLELTCPGNAIDNQGRYAAAYSAYSDWDGDGVNDLLVGSPLERKVRIRSGHTGTTLLEIDGSLFGAALDYGRVVKRAGDLNGDSVEDIFISSWSSTAELRSGVDGSLLESLSISPSTVGMPYFEPMPDVDGDGRDDYLFGVPNALVIVQSDVIHSYYGTLPARVELRSGATGFQLLKLERPAGSFGAQMTRLGDLDGDGKADFGCGNRYMDGGTSLGTFGFQTYSSATGQMLWSTPFQVYTSTMVGDVNGDGVADVANGTGLNVVIRSGANGAYLWGSEVKPAEDLMGSAVSSLDFNGDGVRDVLAGAHQRIGTTIGLGGTFSYHDEGYVEVLDGATGQVLYHIDGDDEAEGLGTGVIVMGDTNGDGAEDFIASSAFVATGTPRLQWISGVSVALTSDVFALSLGAGGEQSFDVDMGAGHMDELAVLLGSVSGHGPGLHWGGGLLPLTTDAYLIQRIDVPKVTLLDGQGRGSIVMAVPPGFAPGLAGLVFHHAFVTLDTATLAVTGASNAIPTTLLQ